MLLDLAALGAARPRAVLGAALLMLVAAAAGCDSECDVADECAMHEGAASRDESLSTDFCGYTPLRLTLGDRTSVSWTVGEESCRCEEKDYKLENCEVSVPDKRKVLCEFESAQCFTDICSGCTAGGIGECPPKPSAYGKKCRENAVSDCERTAHSGSRSTLSTSQVTYTRNVRMIYGVATCEELQNGATPSDEKVLCDGECPPL